MFMDVTAKGRELAGRILPKNVRRTLVRLANWPPVGLVRFGSLRRTRPINANWGQERGGPVDRYYIENFLGQHEADVRGRVLEIGTDHYTKTFGGGKVDQSDVLHVAETKPEVTIIGDLTSADHIPSDKYDCVILTQTLQCIYDVRAAIRTVHRILRPGGVVLATIPGISKISRYDMDRWGYYWSFTEKSAERLFGEFFPDDKLSVMVHGNVLAAISFLHGIAANELKQRELDAVDPDYQLLITIRAAKANVRP